jgi:hypothetical protein
MYSCYRTHVEASAPAYRFGGAFGYGYTDGPRTYGNGITGSDTCPGGYSGFQILNTPNKDYPVYFCAK